MEFNFNIGKGADDVVNYILDNFTPALDVIAYVIGQITGSLQAVLTAVPPVGGVLILSFIALWRVGWKFALFTLLSLALINHMNLWEGTMVSLSLVLAATIIAGAIGLPQSYAQDWT